MASAKLTSITPKKVTSVVTSVVTYIVTSLEKRSLSGSRINTGLRGVQVTYVRYFTKETFFCEKLEIRNEKLGIFPLLVKAMLLVLKVMLLAAEVMLLAAEVMLLHAEVMLL